MPEIRPELLLPISLDDLVDQQAVIGHSDHGIWTIYTDSQRTPASEYSTIKSNQRTDYDEARARLHIIGYTSPCDVLLINQDGYITETSISTIYIRQAGRWVTPTLNSGCQAGTTRRWALERGYCTEQDIHVNDLGICVCIVSNGVKGFALGRIIDTSARLSDMSAITHPS